MLTIPKDFAIIEDNIDIEVDSILNSTTSVVLNLVKEEKKNSRDKLTIKWTQVVKLLRDKKIRYITFQPCNESTIAVSSIGSLNKSIASAFMDLPSDKCCLLIFNVDFQILSEIQVTKEFCYFEWVPPGAPFRDHILHGVYTGSFFEHWRDKIFEISNVPPDARLLRRFPGSSDLKLSKEEFCLRKAQIISQYTWPEMRVIYLVYYRLLPLYILPQELLQIILTFAFLVS
jgi:hypothetical protein